MLFLTEKKGENILNLQYSIGSFLNLHLRLYHHYQIMGIAIFWMVLLADWRHCHLFALWFIFALDQYAHWMEIAPFFMEFWFSRYNLQTSAHQTYQAARKQFSRKRVPFRFHFGLGSWWQVESTSWLDWPIAF